MAVSAATACWRQQQSKHSRAAAKQAGVRALLALDDAFHWLVYGVAGTSAAATIPSPELYFAVLAFHRVPAAAAELPSTPAAEAPLRREAATAPNPLLGLLEARCEESEAYFGASVLAVEALAPAGMGARPGEPPTLKATDPVCGALLAEWRDGVLSLIHI